MISFSVIVNTHNRCALLADTLQGLMGLRYPRFEVIVVNGPSTDGTPALLDEWRNRIKRVECAEANLSVSRNAGIEAASGDVVAFIDDDAVPHPLWLTELSYPYADPRVGGVGGFTLDHTGVRFQARKTVCDRYGNAFERPDDYDERVLNRPGGEFYPSLLGTNSSFRRSAVRAVGGFDPVFAYFLDETDLCLRLTDAGWRVVYAPEALVFHQFAPSVMRDVRRVPQSIYALAVSKAYFVLRHGARWDLEESGRQLAAYEAKMRADNARLHADKAIDLAHKVKLDDELTHGMEAGRAAAFGGALVRRIGDSAAEEFRDFRLGSAKSIAVLARTRSAWVEESLRAIGAQGWIVHLICEGDAPASRFHECVWRHQVTSEAGVGTELAGRRDIPVEVADWCETAAGRFRDIEGFGIDLVASTLKQFPGLAVRDRVSVLLRDASTAEELAAHPEWAERVLFSHFHCEKLIAMEKQAAAAVAVQIGPGDDIAAILGGF